MDPDRAASRHVPTAEEAYAALRDHVAHTARLARARHGALTDEAGVRRLLADPQCLRFPTRLVFDDTPLLPGEFAHARRRGGAPGDGFDLVVHPRFAGRDADLPLLVAYHVVSVNTLDVAGHEEAELYGATLLGMEQGEYYRRVCALADEVGAPTLSRLDVPGWQALGLPDARMAPPPAQPGAPACACGGASPCAGPREGGEG